MSLKSLGYTVLKLRRCTLYLDRTTVDGMVIILLSIILLNLNSTNGPYYQYFYEFINLSLTCNKRNGSIRPTKHMNNHTKTPNVVRDVPIA